MLFRSGPGQNANSLLAKVDAAIAAGIPTFDMSAGEQLRDYVPVQEVAEQLVFLLEHPDASGIFNICSGEPVSVRRLVERHVKERDARIRLNLGVIPYPVYEALAFWGSPDKITSLRGARRDS